LIFATTVFVNMFKKEKKIDRQREQENETLMNRRIEQMLKITLPVGKEKT